MARKSGSSATPRAAPPAAVHPATSHQHAVRQSLEARTGRTLEAWVALVRAERGLAGSARVAWLRSTHGLGMTSANIIVAEADGTPPDEDAAAVEQKLFAGARAVMRPIYEVILARAAALGPDVTITPCATMVPIRRHHVIAQVKPLASRLDLGLALGTESGKLPARLLATGGVAKGDRITHVIRLAAPSEVDATVDRWLQRAYALDG